MKSKFTGSFRKHLLIGMCLFASVGAYAAGENLLTQNPSFEDGSKGWERVDGKYWRISKNAAPWRDGGDHCLQRIAFKGTKKGMVENRFNSQKIPVKAGGDYSLSAGMSGSGGGDGSWTMLPVLKVLDAQGKEIAVLEGEKLPRASARGGYKRLAKSLKMPEGAAQAQVGVRLVIDEDLTDISYLHYDVLSLSEVEEVAQ